MLKERLPDVKERFSHVSENLPDENVTETGAGVLLIVGGAAASVWNLVRGRRGASAWVLPVSLLASGLAFAITGAVQWRSGKIEHAEERVRGELDSLDPLARAQVLKEVAQEQVERYVPQAEGQ